MCILRYFGKVREVCNDPGIIAKFLKINLFIFLFIYFWLRWVFVAAGTFSSCSEWGLLFLAVRVLLPAVASLVAEHGL